MVPVGGVRWREVTSRAAKTLACSTPEEGALRARSTGRARALLPLDYVGATILSAAANVPSIAAHFEMRPRSAV